MNEYNFEYSYNFSNEILSQLRSAEFFLSHWRHKLFDYCHRIYANRNHFTVCHPSEMHEMLIMLCRL